MPRRLVAHLDMDAFYASVELLRHPELRGRAVVVGGSREAQPVRDADADGGWRYARLGDYVGRGVVTTASYEARALGVHSAMGMMKAARLAPEAVLLPADFDAYRAASRRFKAAVREIAPVVEDRGIDEIYIDLTDVPGAQADAGRAVGLALKEAVRAATGLTCSVGIAPNKLLAKLCSEFDKPDGLTLLDAADIPARVWPLPARRLNGIGPKADARLAALGIVTLGDLAAADPALLGRHFGAGTAAWMHAAAHGRDDRSVVIWSEPKAISRETTFERDLHAVRDRAELSSVFTWLCEKLGADLERKGYAARSIGIKLRYDDFRTVTRDATLAAPTADAQAIRRAAGSCLKRVDLGRRLRLLGVRAGGLVRLTEVGADAESAPDHAGARAGAGAGATPTVTPKTASAVEAGPASGREAGPSTTPGPGPGPGSGRGSDTMLSLEAAPTPASPPPPPPPPRPSPGTAHRPSRRAAADATGCQPLLPFFDDPASPVGPTSPADPDALDLPDDPAFVLR